MDYASALSAVGQLPADAQFEVAQQIIENLAKSGWQLKLAPEQKAEFDRRWAAFEADPSNVLTWEEVEAGFRRPP